MTTQPNISVTTPVSEAIERTKQILFRPFDLTRWFIIGFSAWLATLGEGGYSAHFPGGGGGRGSDHSDSQQAFEQGRDYFVHNLFWIIPLVAFVLIVFIGFVILLTWVNSRGKFMFLHCVALNKAEVGEPWRKYAALANSLFAFRLGLALVGFAITVPILIVAGVIVAGMVTNHSPSIVGILCLIGLAMIFILLIIVFGLINLFTRDFVVPIMFRQEKRCVESWAIFRRMLAANAGQFTLYVLFQIVLSMGIASVLVAVVLLTFCIAGCLLAIPYLGTVLLLPVLVFRRAYSLHYLAQYGPEYNVFPAPTYSVASPT
jgi:hypothetical protein